MMLSGPSSRNLFPGELIVANNNRGRTRESSHELIEVVGERVVVVDDQGLHDNEELLLPAEGKEKGL